MFRLGVAVDPAPEHARFRGMLSIPYVSMDDDVVQIRFRCMEDHKHSDFHHGKYNTVKGDPARLYGADALRDAGGEIHITEGEFDCMTLRMCGLHSVAIPGANAWSGRHRREMPGFSRVFVWADPDEAGAELAQKIRSSLPRSYRPVTLRSGDVNETFAREGRDGVLSLLNAAREGEE